MKKRLDKIVSNHTPYSRKEISKMIKKGMIKVNDQIIYKPNFLVNSEQDKIFVNDNEINIENFFYFALNKPQNYVCSNSNQDGESILNLLQENYLKNLHIVGRLDKDTTGLILITNDGHFTHYLKSSKNQVEKEYEVKLEKEFTNEMHEELKKEIVMDGKILKPFQIYNINNNYLNIILTEGKYHQIKRLFQIVNNPVIHLKRIRIGHLKLADLNIKEGQYTTFKKNQI